jgi:hypothetical protein
VSGSVTVSVTSTLSASDDWWNSLAVDGVDTGLNDSGRRQGHVGEQHSLQKGNPDAN